MRRDGLIFVCNTWRMRNVTHTMYAQAEQLIFHSLCMNRKYLLVN